MGARAFVRLPHLAREVALRADDEVPRGIVVDDLEDGRFVVRSVTRLADANASAIHEGVRADQRIIDAQKFCPGLEVHVVGARALLAEQRFLAELLLEHAPAVEIQPGGLMLDIAGVADAPVRLARIADTCTRTGHAHVLVVADSGRLARAASFLREPRGAAGALREAPARGFGAPVVHITAGPRGNLEEILAQLDLHALELHPALVEQLHALGVTRALHIRALLDRGGLERLGDHGKSVLDLFARLTTPEPIRAYVPSPRIFEELDLDDPIGALEPLSFVLRRLVERICLRVAARHERVADVRLTLVHRAYAGGLASRTTAHPPTVVEVSFPSPTIEQAAVLRTLMMRLERVALPAVVDALTLEAVRRTAARTEQLPLDPHARAAVHVEDSLARLLAEMRAELGVDRAGAFTITEDVLPEKMTALVWPPQRPRAPDGPKPRRRARKNAPVVAESAPTRGGKFLAAWPWPVRFLPRPARLERDASVRDTELLGVLEGEERADAPYARSYVVLSLHDGRRALGVMDEETEDVWVCGWFD